MTTTEQNYFELWTLNRIKMRTQNIKIKTKILNKFKILIKINNTGVHM